jgi:hypothetical protein
MYASGGHLSGSLEKALNQTKKVLEKIKGKALKSNQKGTQPRQRSHQIYLVGLKKSSNKLGYLHTKVSCPIVGSDVSCDGAVKLVDSWEFLFVLFNKRDGQSYWWPLPSGFDSLVINWQIVNSKRYYSRGDPQETLYCVRSPIRFVRSSSILMCSHDEAERSVWVNGPSSRKEQKCVSHAKLSGTSRHTYVCTESARAWARELVEALGTSDANNSLLSWTVFPPWRPSWSKGAIIRWEDQLAVLCAKMFQQDVHADSPAECVPHPEQSASHICHRPWAHNAFYFCHDTSLDQTVMARKAKARKCTAEIVGNI